jgi:FKBP-type peptidyl-prolyl cis-trans isomerase
MNPLRICLAAALGAGLAVVGCTRKPHSQKDQVSYTIGAQFGKSLKAQNLDLDAKTLAQGIEDGLKGKSLQMSDEEMQGSMMKLSDERQKDMKTEAEANKVKADAFLAKNKGETGIQTTASGLQYKITEPGTGPSPKLDDTVVVNYKGTLIDGTEFDSSYKRNMPAEFPIKGVIPGWTEGLQLLKKGGKATFYVPPELGYGDRPRQQIPSNAVLIFDVELLDVKPTPKAAGGPGGLPMGHPNIHTGKPQPAAKPAPAKKK